MKTQCTHTNAFIVYPGEGMALRNGSVVWTGGIYCPDCKSKVHPKRPAGRRTS